ncbi:MAG: type II secretion system protein [Eggerthellaceae bacterium]|nr:type II secretion system protein [Eggerthellaceae bacterium]
MRPVARKLRMQAGFTLVEMLAALLVLSLMTGLVASGVSAGTRMYQQERFESQAQVLAGTINSTLADPVRFMQKTGSTCTMSYEGNLISFPANGTPLQVDGDGHLYLQGSESGSNQVKLLNAGIYDACKVESLDSQLKSEPNADGTTAYVFEGSYTIAGPNGFSKDFTFAIVPQFGVSRGNTASSGSGGSGSGGAGTIVDKAPLDVQLSAARSELAAGTDKPDSAKSALQTAIDAAQAVYENTNAAQDDVNSQVLALIAARAAFANASSASVNYDSLGVLLGEVGQIDSRMGDAATALQRAYSDASALYDNKSATGQEEVDAQYAALQNALNTYRGVRYTADLAQAIENANSAKQTERVDANGVTTWLNSALSNARAAVNNPTGYPQSQIDTYTADLQNATAAYNALEKKSSGGGGEVVAPTAGQAASQADLDKSTYGASWGSGSWTWKNMNTFDNPAVTFLALENNGGTQVRLIYYDNKYWKPIDWNGNDTKDVFNDWASDKFVISHLGDGSYHVHGWSESCKWIAIS